MYQRLSSVLFLGAALLLFPGGPATWAQQPDFNINTQMIDLRSTGNASGGTGSDLSPGFNPCLGGTRSATGTCVGSTGLLSSNNLNNLFPSLGPGAVTYNMFGIISAATVSACADGSVVLPNGLVSGLNCGALHFDPATQGQTIPLPNPGAVVNNLTGPFTAETPFTANFCASGSGDCSAAGTPDAAHTAFELKNSFTWTPSGANANISVTQQMLQVTALNTGGGNTIGGPTPSGSTTPPNGTGDQLVKVTASFTNTSSAGGAFSAPTVNWSMMIQDPDMSGSGPGFSQNISGSFLYNSPASNFTCATGGQGCSQYPSGPTQTLRSQGLDPAASGLSESLP